MTGNEYQKLAARTINQGLILGEQKNHALHGMVGHWMTSCKRTSISSKPDILKVLKQTRVCIEQKGYLR